MFSFTTFTMPHAVSSIDRRMRLPRAASAASALLLSMRIVPPAKYSGFSTPSARLASVTVGSVPPRP
jgi:hypothetical protein